MLTDRIVSPHQQEVLQFRQRDRDTPQLCPFSVQQASNGINETSRDDNFHPLEALFSLHFNSI